ncbi:hypothetical protein ACIPLC_36880 [Kitasatospora sp. NPDC086801]
MAEGDMYEGDLLSAVLASTPAVDHDHAWVAAWRL